MKAGIVTVLALAASASAQVRRGDRHHNRHVHPKRDNVVVETQVQYATATAPHAVVYVDENGKPISTAYDGSAPAGTPYKAPAPAPEKSSSFSSPKAPAPAAYTAPAPSPYSQPATKPKSSSSPAKQPKHPSSAPASYGSGSGSDTGSGRGISYVPYQAAGGCKTQDQVNSDFEKISGYSIVRLYGVDCNQVKTVLNAAKPKGMKLFVGIFDVAQASTEAQTLIDAAKGDWSSIDTVSVGNEWVNGGKGSADQVVGAIKQVRGQLKAAGYTGHVVTVDTFVAMIANPSLCQASDYAAANCHAFFDGGKTAQEAGSFVADQAQRVKQACGGKRTVITESGWPWQGETNGAAVPSRSNQQAALDSLKSKFDKDIFLYTAFDDMWKSDFSGSFDCEKYWGFIQ